MKRSIRWMEKRRRKEAHRVRLLCDELARASSRKQFWTRTIEIEQRRRRPTGIDLVLRDIKSMIADMKMHMRTCHPQRTA